MLGSHPWKRRRTSPFACLLVVTLGILGWGCLLPAVAGQSLREETSIGESGYKKILSAIQRDLDRGEGHVIDGDDDRVMFTWIVSTTRGAGLSVVWTLALPHDTGVFVPDAASRGLIPRQEHTCMPLVLFELLFGIIISQFLLIRVSATGHLKLKKFAI